MPARAIPDEDEEFQPRPFEDIFLLPIPMPTYKALSNAAAKRGLTVAQLISKAFDVALRKE